MTSLLEISKRLHVQLLNEPILVLIALVRCLCDVMDVVDSGPLIAKLDGNHISILNNIYFVGNCGS